MKWIGKGGHFKTWFSIGHWRRRSIKSADQKQKATKLGIHTRLQRYFLQHCTSGMPLQWKGSKECRRCKEVLQAVVSLLTITQKHLNKEFDQEVVKLDSFPCLKSWDYKPRISFSQAEVLCIVLPLTFLYFINLVFFPVQCLTLSKTPLPSPTWLSLGGPLVPGNWGICC